MSGTNLTELRNSASASIFKNDLLKFIRPNNSNIYNVLDAIGLKLLTRLRVNLSHLRQHKFSHNFLDTLNPLCSCSLEVESTSHYLLRCSFYADKWKVLFDSISNAIGDLSNLSENELTNLLLYGKGTLSREVNTCILKSTIIYLKSSERFDGDLF